MAPNKPKPPKITGDTLKVWGLKNTNDKSVLRVLKAVELLSPSGEPTNNYISFMRKDNGPATLGRQVKRVYSTLFENITNPEKASNDELRSFFNIHSGGSEDTIRFQIETFKALASYATFGESDPLEKSQDEVFNNGKTQGKPKDPSEGPTIHIDLHIHLPENKTKADYDALMESIATHLYRLQHE